MRLDHVAYAVSHQELMDTVQRLGRQLGASFSDGGQHPTLGTTNFILALHDGTYLEVVAALDHPAADKAPFGKAVRTRAEAGGGWLGWVVAVEDIEPFEARLGREAVDGSRIRPDGTVLTWKQIGIKDMLRDPSLPFFIQWTCAPGLHPGAGGNADVVAVAAEVCGDREAIREWLGGQLEHPLSDGELQWFEGDEKCLQAVHFRTANGEVVRID